MTTLAEFREAVEESGVPVPPEVAALFDSAAAEGRDAQRVAEPDLGESHAIDVNELQRRAGDRPAEPFVVEGLQRPKEIAVVVAEEGDGKTTFADQFCRQLLRRDQLFDLFPSGDRAPRRILFVDTHQEEPEGERRAADMSARGLDVEDDRLFWWHPESLRITNAADRAQLEAEIVRVGADYLWIDAASHLVTKNEDEQVAPLFDYLSSLMRRYDLIGIGMTLFLRKRAQGVFGRQFDDLFGSREWKGRASKVLYLDGSRIIAWKDRGGDLRRLWPGRPGEKYARATLERPGLIDGEVRPFRIVPGEVESFDEFAMEARAIGLVEAEPATYTKTALAGLIGGRKQDALAVVERLMAEGRIGPRKDRAKLSIVTGEAVQQALPE